MKTLLLKTFLLTALAVFLVACSDDDDDGYKPVRIDNGVLIVSNGYESNYGTLGYYDFSTDEVTSNIFKTNNNGAEVGNMAQSVLVYGSKIYLTVQQSGRIYIMDRQGKLLNTISGENVSPKMLEAYNGKVYVGMYNHGQLASIDTTTMKIDKTIAVGPNPEFVKAVNGKIYVANSGGLNWQSGYNNTVSIVDPELTTETSFEVPVNPVELHTYGNKLFLISRGNYDDIKSSLYEINTSSNQATLLKENVFSIYPFQGSNFYVLDKNYDENFNPISTVMSFDAASNTFNDKSFITDNTQIADIANVAFDPISGKIFVAAANSTDTGDLYIFSSSGKLESKYDIGGIFPSKVVFIYNR